MEQTIEVVWNTEKVSTIQVRMPTFQITEDDRRAIRFITDQRKTMCSRKEAQAFIQAAVDRALRDLRYRWHGPQVSEAVLNGADPEGVASHEKPANPEAAAEPVETRDLEKV